VRHFALFPALACTVALSCSISSLEMAGGSTSTPNERVMGKLFFSTGAPAPRTVVQLIPSAYDQIKGIPLASLPTDTTDDSGAYSFATVDSGTYTIQAVQLDNRTRSLITGIHVDRDTIVVPADTLRVPGTIKLFLPPGINSTLGYIYIPGTSYVVFLNNRTDFIVLDSVPANVIPALSYSTIQSTSTTTIRYSISINSHDTTVVWNPLWKYSRTLVLNTTVAGADVSGDVMDFPVLVRLKSGNFDFSQEKTGGADIRFTKSDNTFLPYEVERWNSAQSRAEIWVKIDTVRGNDNAQSITMYWGNENAVDNSNGPAVFDIAEGFIGVWHLAGNSALDATYHHYDGSPSATAPQVIQGIAGPALQFDGIENGILMKNTSAGPLNFSRPGTYTFSAWVSVDSVYDEDEFIAGKGLDQYALRIKGSKSIPASMFALHEYFGSPVYGTEMRYGPVAMQQWKYMVGVRDTAGSYLFIDGRCVDSSGMLLYGGGNPVDTANFSIGRCGAVFNGNDYLPFKGKIDEVRIASVRFSADWIKLSYMNQKPVDMLIQFAK
jgi:hypothetical protein